MSDTTQNICPSCGIVNPSANTVCSGCGTPMEHPAAAPAAAEKKSPAKPSAAPMPQWLRALLGMFGLFAVAVIIIEVQNMPSGTVQRNQPSVPQDHVHTDPNLITQITELESRVKAEPKNGPQLLQFANLLHDARFYPRAIEAYKQFLALEPANADARVDLGICYYETGDLPAAVKEIEGVIKRNPKHQMAMFNLGVIQLSAQNMAESKKWLQRCIELDPQSTAGQRAQQILQQHQ